MIRGAKFKNKNFEMNVFIGKFHTTEISLPSASQTRITRVPYIIYIIYKYTKGEPRPNIVYTYSRFRFHFQVEDNR